MDATAEFIEGDGWVTVWPVFLDRIVETWRPTHVLGYEVSDQGRVRNSSGLILKPWKVKTGHCYVSLGASIKRQVHRLVLLAFVGPPPTPKHESLHGNGIPWDNRLTNLSWGTRKENLFDYVRHNGKHIRAALTPAQAEAIRAELVGIHYRRGARAAAAQRHGVSIHVINDLMGRHYKTTRVS